MVFPAATFAEKSFIVGTLLLSYWNLTFLNSTLPFTFSIDTGFKVSGASSFSSKNSKTLSAAAIVDCNTLLTFASCAIGCVNCLIYCKKICIFTTNIVTLI